MEATNTKQDLDLLSVMSSFDQSILLLSDQPKSDEKTGPSTTTPSNITATTTTPATSMLTTPASILPPTTTLTPTTTTLAPTTTTLAPTTATIATNKSQFVLSQLETTLYNFLIQSPPQDYLTELRTMYKTHPTLTYPQPLRGISSSTAPIQRGRGLTSKDPLYVSPHSYYPQQHHPQHYPPQYPPYQHYHPHHDHHYDPHYDPHVPTRERNRKY